MTTAKFQLTDIHDIQDLLSAQEALHSGLVPLAVLHDRQGRLSPLRGRVLLVEANDPQDLPGLQTTIQVLRATQGDPDGFVRILSELLSEWEAQRGPGKFLPLPPAPGPFPASLVEAAPPRSLLGGLRSPAPAEPPQGMPRRVFGGMGRLLVPRPPEPTQEVLVHVGAGLGGDRVAEANLIALQEINVMNDDHVFMAVFRYEGAEWTRVPVRRCPEVVDFMQALMHSHSRMLDISRVLAFLREGVVQTQGDTMSPPEPLPPSLWNLFTR